MLASDKILMDGSLAPLEWKAIPFRHGMQVSEHVLSENEPTFFVSSRRSSIW